MEHAPERKTRSVWPYLGVGCLAVVLMGVLVVCAGGFLAFRAARKVYRPFTDPEGLRAEVLESLGSDGLPEGYDPVLALSIPFVFDVVVIGDVVPGEGNRVAEIGDRAFALVSVARIDRANRERIERFFSGRGDDLGSVEIDVDAVDFSAARIVGTSRTGIDGGKVDIVALDAPVTRRGGARERHLIAALHIRCRDDARERFGLWFELPAGGGGTAPETPDLAGSVADPGRVAGFLGRFGLCRDG